MNPFDMVITVVLGYAVIRGIFRGLIKEVSSLLGLVVGFYVAYAFHKDLSSIFSSWITEPAYREITSFILLFCVVFFIITLLGILVRFVVKLALLGVIDRIFGGIFGALKAVLAVSFIYILFVTFLPQDRISAIKGSKLAPKVYEIGKKVVSTMPEDVKNSYNKKLQEFKNDWNQTTSKKAK